jgi:hypothetical protein
MRNDKHILKMGYIVKHGSEVERKDFYKRSIYYYIEEFGN